MMLPNGQLCASIVLPPEIDISTDYNNLYLIIILIIIKLKQICKNKILKDIFILLIIQMYL